MDYPGARGVFKCRQMNSGNDGIVAMMEYSGNDGIVAIMESQSASAGAARLAGRSASNSCVKKVF